MVASRAVLKRNAELTLTSRPEPESNWQGVTNLQNKVYTMPSRFGFKDTLNMARRKGC